MVPTMLAIAASTSAALAMELQDVAGTVTGAR